MENNSELIGILKELREENRSQKELLKKQYRTMRSLGLLLACLVAAVALFLFILLPRVTGTLNELNVVVSNTQDITNELKDADIEGTIRSLTNTLDSVNGLVDDSSESLSITLKKLEAMDIDTLNKAINDLYQVVNPLASLFSR